MTLGGPVRAGIVSAIDRAGNTLRVDLPTGETRVLGIQPQAVMLHDGQAGSTAGLIPGDTVLFETAPGQNAVAILTLVQPALRARVLAVSEGAMTVRFVENERVVMGAVSAGPATFFLDRGMPVSAGGMPAAYQVGEIVWIYSLPQGRARFVLGEVAAGI